MKNGLRYNALPTLEDPAGFSLLVLYSSGRGVLVAPLLRILEKGKMDKRKNKTVVKTISLSDVALDLRDSWRQDSTVSYLEQIDKSLKRITRYQKSINEEKAYIRDQMNCIKGERLKFYDALLLTSEKFLSSDIVIEKIETVQKS